MAETCDVRSMISVSPRVETEIESVTILIINSILHPSSFSSCYPAAPDDDITIIKDRRLSRSDRPLRLIEGYQDRLVIEPAQSRRSLFRARADLSRHANRFHQVIDRDPIQAAHD